MNKKKTTSKLEIIIILIAVISFIGFVYVTSGTKSNNKELVCDTQCELLTELNSIGFEQE